MINLKVMVGFTRAYCLQQTIKYPTGCPILGAEVGYCRNNSHMALPLMSHQCFDQ